MGIRFDAQTAYNVMKGTPGAASNILYKVKMVLDRLKEFAAREAVSVYEPEPGEEVWADWKHPGHAKAWAKAQGKFDHDKHLDNAYAKVKTDCAPKTARDMWRCWYAYVMAHEPAKTPDAPATEQPADPDGWAEIDENGVPQEQAPF